MGLADGDPVEIESPHGRAQARLRLMDGCAENTVWTWNAIGKRAGAWGLAPNAPEVTSGFLLNQVIGERLPAANGYHHANADPITGQAAWFDLRVRVRRSAEAGAPARPDFATASAS
jgi:sulfite dehydrogenase (quinone) subunit SoeA